MLKSSWYFLSELFLKDLFQIMTPTCVRILYTPWFNIHLSWITYVLYMYKFNIHIHTNMKCVTSFKHRVIPKRKRREDDQKSIVSPIINGDDPRTLEVAGMISEHRAFCMGVARIITSYSIKELTVRKTQIHEIKVKMPRQFFIHRVDVLSDTQVVLHTSSGPCVWTIGGEFDLKKVTMLDSGILDAVNVLAVINNHLVFDKMSPDKKNHGFLRYNAKDNDTFPDYFMGHASRVLHVHGLSDQKRAISATATTLRLWDLGDHRSAKLIGVHLDDSPYMTEITDMDSTSDCKLLVSANWDRTLCVWDLEKLVCVHVLRGHWKGVVCVKILDDDQRAISGSKDKRLLMWNLESGECMYRFESSHFEEFNNLQVYGDSVLCDFEMKSDEYSSEMCAPKLLNLESGECSDAATTQDDTDITALLPDGRLLMFSSYNRDHQTGEMSICIRVFQ